MGINLTSLQEYEVCNKSSDHCMPLYWDWPGNVMFVFTVVTTVGETFSSELLFIVAVRESHVSIT